MTELVIWAHSECRSTMALFREVKRQAGVPVTVALWKFGDADDIRKRREESGQKNGEYNDLDLVPVGEDLLKGQELIARHCSAGTVHVFCVYQNSRVWRSLIALSKKLGLRVIVYAEAPCEMCVGVKALLKRLYYRFILPFKLHDVARTADVFLSQSGEMGTRRLLRLGWTRKKIVPFGYASAVGFSRVGRAGRMGENRLRILHTGIEARYRDVETLCKAAEILRRHGVEVEVFRTHGGVPVSELVRLYDCADVFVACGLCEPWGMRVVDAIHAGLPVFVSDGMGAKWLVEQFGCGCVFHRGRANELVSAMERYCADAGFRAKLADGVAAAHVAWLPENRAGDFLKAIEG